MFKAAKLCQNKSTVMTVVGIEVGMVVRLSASGKTISCSLLQLFLYSVYVHEGSFPEGTVTSENARELSREATKGNMQDGQRDPNPVHPQGSRPTSA